MTTLLRLLDDAVARNADHPALGLRRDDGTTLHWTYRELDRRSRIAAWRLRALGLQPGDRLLTWSPSTPELPATYFGAMRAGLVLVPLDLRMSTEAVEGIVAASRPNHLAIGTGRDAPDPRDAKLERFPTTTVDALCAEPDANGEIQFRGPSLFAGYWERPDLTAAAYTEDGWYSTGDIGHLDAGGRLVLSGRKRDIIVLPNGFNVDPEDLENALRAAGIRESVCLETRPGRIEAIVLAPDSPIIPQGGDIPGARPDGLSDDPTEAAALRARIDAVVKAANATLGPSQRIVAWRLWPDIDFPRTHTLKVKRDRVRAWATVEAPLPVSG